MPQNFIATLARAPNVRTVRFDSPGGHVQPAMQIAAMIRSRGLDTYVPRSCASACTLAFLAGKSRFLAPTARLGFHQAHAPGVPPEHFDPMMRAAYEKAGVPDGFIDHVLRTPPTAIWFPTQSELHAAGLTTGTPPAAIAGADNTVLFRWVEAMRLVSTTPEVTIVAFAETFSMVLEHLQTTDPEICWGLFHRIPADLRASLPRAVVDAMAKAEQQVREAAHSQADPHVVNHSVAPTVLDPVTRQHILASLIREVREEDRDAVVAGLAPGGNHPAFCPAVRMLLATARARPDSSRVQALRALITGS
jgi:hypothetical protein